MEKFGFDYFGIAGLHLFLNIFGTGLLALPAYLLFVADWIGCLSTLPTHEEIWILFFGFQLQKTNHDLTILCMHQYSI